MSKIKAFVVIAVENGWIVEVHRDCDKVQDDNGILGTLVGHQHDHATKHVFRSILEVVHFLSDTVNFPTTTEVRN